jgi:cyclopropane fatty-acyl-phospholipid synthase-like methyltransferase
MINTTFFIFIMLWIISVALFIHTKSYMVFVLPYLLFFAHELIYYVTGFSLFPSGDLTSTFYDLATIVTNNDDVTPNYTEGYYTSLDLTPYEAEIAKFDKIIELLGIRPGDKVLDLGCGTSSTEEYFQSKGIDILGLTLSEQQAQRAQNKGLKAIHWDFMQFNPALVGRFDHIIMMGSSEHISTGRFHDIGSYERKKELLTQLFSMFTKYFKKDSHSKQIFFSGIHVNPEHIYDPELFILQRTYGGLYIADHPSYDVYSAANDAGFELKYARDVTEHYYKASVLDRDHFGVPGDPNSKYMIMLFSFGFIYPLAWYIWYYAVYGVWMWQFDGKAHKLHATDHARSFTMAKRKNRPTTTLWGVFKYQGTGFRNIPYKVPYEIDLDNLGCVKEKCNTIP